jgi:sporulation protein YunB
MSRVKPIITVFAKAEAREAVLRAMNDAIAEELSGAMRYEDLVTIQKDANGNVTALITDMTKINLLQARVSNSVATHVVNLMSTKLTVPLGDVLGGVLLTGHGPGLPVRIHSVSDIHARYVNNFESAGINQTRHRIVLEVTAEMDLLIPGGRTSTSVTVEVAVAETIIVGTVPNVYANTGVTNN